jgi:catalase
MTVQQHHRFPRTAIPHPERHLADIDTVQLEAIEHEPHLPGRSSANRERKSHPAGYQRPAAAARLFFYLDTQLTRLGGPNFTQLPVNQPHCPVNDMLRDGMHQTAVHTGLALYRSNSLDGGQPLTADAPDGGYVQVACPVEGVTARANPVSFGDHFSQAAMFYRSLTPLEQAHIVEAFTFELGKCHEQAVKERQLQVLANVDESLCAQVAGGLGLPAPQGSPSGDVTLSPALSQVATEPARSRAARSA